MTLIALFFVFVPEDGFQKAFIRAAEAERRRQADLHERNLADQAEIVRTLHEAKAVEFGAAKDKLQRQVRDGKFFYKFETKDRRTLRAAFDRQAEKYERLRSSGPVASLPQIGAYNSDAQRYQKFQVGDCGMPVGGVRIVQIVDAQNVIVEYGMRNSGIEFWLQDYDTSRLQDDEWHERLPVVLYFTGNKTYATAAGGSKTLLLARVAKDAEVAEAEKLVPQTLGGFRTFTDSTGKHTVEAKFLTLQRSEVELQKRDGSNLKLPLNKLSTADRRWIRLQATPWLVR